MTIVFFIWVIFFIFIGSCVDTPIWLYILAILIAWYKVHTDDEIL